MKTSASPLHDLALVRDLVALFIRDRQYQQARDLLLQALDGVEKPDDARRMHLEVALISDQGLGDQRTAVEHLQRALAIDPKDPEVFAFLSDILARTRREPVPKPQAPATRKQWSAPAADTRKPASSVRHVTDPARHIDRVAIRVLPSPRDAKSDAGFLARIERAKTAAERDQIMAELRERLDERPEDVTLWRALCAATYRAEQHDAAFRCVQIIELLGGRTDADLRLGSYAVRPAQAANNAFPRSVLESLGKDLLPWGPLGELLSALEPAFRELCPLDLTSYGTTTRAKLQRGTSHPLRALCDRVLDILGASELDLYVHRARTRDVGLELSEPVSLLLPTTLSAEPESRSVFLIARSVVLCARRIPCATRLSPAEIESVVQAYVSSVVRNYAAGRAQLPKIAPVLARAEQALTSDARQGVHEAAKRYADAPTSVQRWIEAQLRIATRAAALIADDPGVLKDGPEERAARRDLFKLWASDLAMKTRTRAGIA